MMMTIVTTMMINIIIVIPTYLSVSAVLEYCSVARQFASH